MTTKTTTKTTKAKTPSPEFVIADITEEILQERLAQVSRWGQQDHPSSYSDLDRKRAEKNADRWKEMNDARVKAGTLTWDGILLEEVWEALAESDEARRREELVQVAAVAAAEIEAIDRRIADSAVAESASVRLCPATDEACAIDCAPGTCIEAANEDDDKTHPRLDA